MCDIDRVAMMGLLNIYPLKPEEVPIIHFLSRGFDRSQNKRKDWFRHWH